MNFELLTEAAAISHEELAKITGNEHYPSSRRIRTLKAALAQAGAHPRAFAAAGPEADYSRIDRRNTPSVVINQAGPASRQTRLPGRCSTGRKAATLPGLRSILSTSLA
jgi:hypothetical protein